MSGPKLILERLNTIQSLRIRYTHNQVTIFAEDRKASYDKDNPKPDLESGHYVIELLYKKHLGLSALEHVTSSVTGVVNLPDAQVDVFIEAVVHACQWYKAVNCRDVLNGLLGQHDQTKDIATSRSTVEQFKQFFRRKYEERWGEQPIIRVHEKANADELKMARFESHRRRAAIHWYDMARRLREIQFYQGKMNEATVLAANARQRAEHWEGKNKETKDET